MPERALPRRAVLTATASALAGGCLGALDDGPTCALQPDPPAGQTDGVGGWAFRVTSNTQDHDGRCRRATAAVCLEVTVDVDPARVDRLVGETAAGTRVGSTTVDARGTGDPGASDAEETTDGEGTSDGEARTVRLELAALERGERGSYRVHVVADGERIATAAVDVDCTTD